ncbi:MAG: hypothetical protein WC554_01865 [Clostridia bacterium]
MYTISINKPIKKTGSSKDAKIGDLMRIVEKHRVEEHIILKIYGDNDETQTSLVSLTDPSYTWDGDTDFIVEFLQPGETIILTVQ